MIALVPIRGQPFHNGHLHLIEQASRIADEVIVIIGSAQYSGTIENPFTCAETVEMVRLALRDTGINYKVVSLDDVHDDEKWVRKILDEFEFDIVVSGNLLVQRLFSEKGKRVVEADFLKPEVFSGTEIRRRIKEGEDWRDLVPPRVYDYLLNVNYSTLK